VELYTKQTKCEITENMSLRKKSTKAVNGAVPFQKVHFCT